MARSPDRETATLMDRVALAFLSGLSALMMAGLVWGGVAITAAQLTVDWSPPLWPVGLFAALMALVGFVMLENFVGNLIGSLAGSVLRLLQFLTP